MAQKDSLVINKVQMDVELRVNWSFNIMFLKIWFFMHKKGLGKGTTGVEECDPQHDHTTKEPSYK